MSSKIFEGVVELMWDRVEAAAAGYLIGLDQSHDDGVRALLYAYLERVLLTLPFKDRRVRFAQLLKEAAQQYLYANADKGA